MPIQGPGRLNACARVWHRLFQCPRYDDAYATKGGRVEIMAAIQSMAKALEFIVWHMLFHCTRCQNACASSIPWTFFFFYFYFHRSGHSREHLNPRFAKSRRYSGFYSDHGRFTRGRS